MSHKKTALITGASSGFGAKFAKLFASHGYDLVLVARNQDALATLARSIKAEHDVFVKVIAIDLTKRKSPQTIFTTLKENNIAVDVLVNNAGVGGFGKFIDRDLADELAMIDLNVRALVELTHLFLPAMIEKKQGNILQIASTAGFFSGPLMVNYYATKNYVLSFSEALAEEIKGTGVDVSIICPGPADTSFAKNAGAEHSNLFKGNIMSAKEVAEASYQAMTDKKRIIILGQSKWLIGISRIIPREWMTKIIKRFQDAKRTSKN